MKSSRDTTIIVVLQDVQWASGKRDSPFDALLFLFVLFFFPQDADRLESLGMCFSFSFILFTDFNYRYTTFAGTIMTINNHSTSNSTGNSTSRTSNGGGSSRVEDSRCRCVSSPWCVFFFFFYSFY